MPGVKKLFQESENSAKPEYIHDGLQATRGWQGASVSCSSHVVQMVEDACHAAKVFGDSLLLLNRYFLIVPALEKLKGLNRSGQVQMEIITKAKKSCTAFKKPGRRKPGRGRPPKKGKVIHLKELFVSHKEQFYEAEIELYGKQEFIRYYSLDLLWGQKLYQELRFLLVEMGGIQSIPTSTSLDLDPSAVIRLYSYRFRIKCTFRALKQQTGAFCYHFWSKYMPKLSYYLKKGTPTPLERVNQEKGRKKVLETVRAIEMHVAVSCIAMGILQSSRAFPSKL